MTGSCSLGSKMTLINLLDIASAIGTIVCLNVAPRRYKWWLVYIGITAMFIVVVASKGLVGQTLMGLALIVTGVLNYINGSKQRG